MARPLRKARAEKEGTPGKRSVPHLSSCVAQCGKHNQRKADGLEGPQSSLKASNSRLEAPKWRPGGSKIEPRSLQNQGRSPPRRSCYKTFNLRRLKMTTRPNFWRPKWPTWLHLGGPRPSKIEAEAVKNRCSKTTRFWHRFLKGLDVVLEGFLIGFLDHKRMPKANI